MGHWPECPRQGRRPAPTFPRCCAGAGPWVPGSARGRPQPSSTVRSAVDTTPRPPPPPWPRPPRPACACSPAAGSVCASPLPVGAGGCSGWAHAEAAASNIATTIWCHRVICSDPFPDSLLLRFQVTSCCLVQLRQRQDRHPRRDWRAAYTASRAGVNVAPGGRSGARPGPLPRFHGNFGSRRQP